MTKKSGEQPLNNEPCLLVHEKTKLHFGFVRQPGDVSDRTLAIRCIEGSVPGTAQMAMVGVVQDDGRVVIEPVVKLCIDQLRMLRDNQSEDWLFTWGHVIDGAISALSGGRGRKRKWERALECFDGYIADGRQDTQDLRHVVCEEADCHLSVLEKALRERRKRQN
jgi:hypothetical protein